MLREVLVMRREDVDGLRGGDKVWFSGKVICVPEDDTTWREK